MASFDQLAVDVDIILRRIEGSKSNGKDIVLVEHDVMLRLIDLVVKIGKPWEMVRAGDVTINPAFVCSMEWDRRWYANGPGDSVLVVHMTDGREHRIKHWGETDAYDIERKIRSSTPHRGADNASD